MSGAGDSDMYLYRLLSEQQDPCGDPESEFLTVPRIHSQIIPLRSTHVSVRPSPTDITSTSVDTQWRRVLLFRFHVLKRGTGDHRQGILFMVVPQHTVRVVLNISEVLVPATSFGSCP